MTNNHRIFYSEKPFEESMLRSALLFNSQKTNGGKKDMLLKAILSIIIYGKGEYTLATLCNIFRERFHSTVDNFTIENYIKELIRGGMVDKDSETGKLSVKEDKKGSKFFEDIQSGTEKLITSIVSKAEKSLFMSIPNKEKACENVRKALTTYYRMYGYSLKDIDLQVAPDDEDIKIAIKNATDGFDNKTGQALVVAIADTLQSPSPEESAILYQWARAYIAMHVMNIDPELRNFRAGELRGKTFVLDTDVVLNCIATNAKYSQDYRMMINKLTEIGCTIIIPQEIISEVADHFDSAKKKYQSNGSRWVEKPDENLENDEDSNVFIEDWVKTVRYDSKRADLDFWTYFSNLYDPEVPSFLHGTLEQIFGSKTMGNNLNTKVDESILTKLSEEIKYRTINTPKAINRSPEKNNEISETDAYLYLAITEMNKGTDGGALLNRNAYLLTRTKKSINSAKEIGIFERNVVCEPRVLLAILQEMGTLKPTHNQVFNLFDNPFLTYTANLIWDKVEPLLEAGAMIKHKDYRKLRHDFETDFDKLLTSENYEEKVAEANRLSEKGYLFTQEMTQANKSKEESDEENRRLKLELEETKRKLEEEIQKRKKVEYDKQQLEIRSGDLQKGNTTKRSKLTKIIKGH